MRPRNDVCSGWSCWNSTERASARDADAAAIETGGRSSGVHVDVKRGGGADWVR